MDGRVLTRQYSWGSNAVMMICGMRILKAINKLRVREAESERDQGARQSQGGKRTGRRGTHLLSEYM